MFASTTCFPFRVWLCWLAMLVPAGFGQSIETDLPQACPIADEVPGDTLEHPVKVIFDATTNQYVLVGAKADVAIVKRTILMLNEQFSGRSSIVTEKISLKFQLAETVAEILSSAMSMKANAMSNLNIDALHFPESVLLTGPKASVENAKRLIQSVDSHPGFSSK